MLSVSGGSFKEVANITKFTDFESLFFKTSDWHLIQLCASSVLNTTGQTQPNVTFDFVAATVANSSIVQTSRVPVSCDGFRQARLLGLVNCSALSSPSNPGAASVTGFVESITFDGNLNRTTISCADGRSPVVLPAALLGAVGPVTFCHRPTSLGSQRVDPVTGRLSRMDNLQCHNPQY